MNPPNDDLLQLSVEQLLQRFSAGTAVPGSGCAAAFAGLMSASLIITVCKLTSNKADYAHLSAQWDHITEEARAIQADLKRLFQADNDTFGQVIEARRSRDTVQSDQSRQRHNERSLRLLQAATRLTMKISERCVRLLDLALSVCDDAYSAVAGDSFGAASFAIAGAHTGLFVTKSNLKSFPTTQLADLRDHLPEVTEKLATRERELRSRISRQLLLPRKRSIPSLRHGSRTEAIITTRIRDCAKRLRGRARRELLTHAPRIGTRLAASMSPSDIEAFLLDLEQRLEVEQRLVHNRITVDQIDTLIGEILARRRNHG